MTPAEPLNPRNGAYPVTADARWAAPWQPACGYGPQRIVCLTEETTEWLYLLGEEARIVGISGYTVCPEELVKRSRKSAPF